MDVRSCTRVALSLFVLFTVSARGANDVPDDSTTVGNVISFPIGSGAGVSEADYRKIGADFYLRFAPMVFSDGFYLIPELDWSNRWILGGSRLEGRNFHVYFAGGMARMPGMGRLGMAFVLCHELGHLLAGEPKQLPASESEWASVEGQADDWAVRVCLPRWFREAPRLFLSEAPVEGAQAVCMDGGQEYCALRMSAVAEFLWSYETMMKHSLPRFDTPERSEVESTNPYYPSVQCRLDNAVAASLGRDRSRCWFRPINP